MNDSVRKNDSDSKKVLVLIILIVVFMIAVTGATYAYFLLSPASDNSITGTAATAGLSLDVVKSAPVKENYGVLIPQRESALGVAMNSTNGCVDGNKNAICQVYTITVNNTSNAQINVSGTITFSNSETMPNLKWRIATDVNTLGDGVSHSATSGEVQTLASNVALEPSNDSNTNDTAVFVIVVWIDASIGEDGREIAQTDSGTYQATVTFSSADGTGITSTIVS